MQPRLSRLRIIARRRRRRRHMPTTTGADILARQQRRRAIPRHNIHIDTGTETLEVLPGGQARGQHGRHIVRDIVTRAGAAAEMGACGRRQYVVRGVRRVQQPARPVMVRGMEIGVVVVVRRMGQPVMVVVAEVAPHVRVARVPGCCVIEPF